MPPAEGGGMEISMKITVFTPTYNRGYCLERLFESLLHQTYHNFEWVIVDDGSTDCTQELIQSFQEQQIFFPIIYKKTENGGKHRAINKGMQLVGGEIVFLVDSDDWLREDALESIAKMDASIPEIEKHKYAGIQGLCVHTDGELVGRTFSGDYLDCTAIECRKYNIYGDKAEAYYTNIIKRYPFPEIEGEKFVTERLVWNKIAHDGYVLYAKNPKQWAMAIRQDYDFGVMNAYNTSIQIYIYYLYERAHITIREMADNLNMPVFLFWVAVVVQKVVDTTRFFLHKKNTVLGTAKKDMGNCNW